jgi:hypothetical protein
MSWAGHIAYMQRKRHAYRVLVGCRWERILKDAVEK